jgi:hypothetical protein
VWSNQIGQWSRACGEQAEFWRANASNAPALIRAVPNPLELPLTPRTPRQRVQRHKGGGVRAIVLPRRICGVARKAPLALAVTVAHRANSLKILECSRLSSGYLFSVEVKRRHPAQQKIGRAWTESRDPAQFGSGHADIFGHSLYFVFCAAFEFQCRTPSGSNLATTAKQL